MKKLLTCIITVLSVAACSFDDGGRGERPNPDVPSDEQTNQRMLYRMSIVRNDSDGKHTLTFQYDNQNRIIGFTDIFYEDSGTDYCSTSITYNSDGSIKLITNYNGSSYEYKALINSNGSIASVYDIDQDDTYYYEYDSNGHITSAMVDDNYELYEWENGNMVKNISRWSYMDEGEKHEIHLQYSNYPVKRINIDPNWIVVLDEPEIYILHPDDLYGTNTLFNQRNTSYVSKVTTDWTTTTYTWSFDKQGYPIECISRTVGGEGDSDLIYSFEYL